MDSSILINQKFLETIDYLLPLKSSLLDFLVENLTISKETAYRRLRGDVPFTFEEACVISNKLGFSLNTVVKTALKKIDPTFILYPPPPTSIQEYKKNTYKTYIDQQKLFDRIADDPESKILMALNVISQEFMLPYKNLSKFRIFVWNYQMQDKQEPCKLSSIEIDDKLIGKQDILKKSKLVFRENTCIISRNIFRSLVKLIQYFFQLNLITNDELSMLKEELLMLIDEIEQTTTYDSNNNGGKIWIYLSNIDFESNYTYVSTSKFEQSYIDIYYLNSIVSDDPLVCKAHKEWIESLKRFSTLVSISASIDRIIFFEKQRELVYQLQPALSIQ